MPTAVLSVLLVSWILTCASIAQAKVIIFRETAFGVAGDGLTDDRPALARAFSALEAGDTLLIPAGTYRIVLTSAPLRIPAGTTVLGQSGKTTFILATVGGPKEHREFLRPGSNMTLEGVRLEREGNFPTVLLPIFGDTSDITLRNCSINGNATRFPDAYCHAIQVGVGTLKSLSLQGVEITECTFGLFQQSQATGTVEGVTVENCRFERNTASDLEFNAPKGVMRKITVRDCIFRNNRCNTPSAGFAVGFANVTEGRVENCRIENYGSEALHVEDRSSHIRLAGNVIIGGSLLQSNGIVLVVNDSKDVTIEHNFIDGRPNTNRPHLILVTAGGEHFANPSAVAISNNVLVHGATTQPWYLQPGSGPSPSANHIIEAGSTPH